MDTPRIHQPCHESWAAMTPRDGGRYCAVCDKVVIDLTRLSPSQTHARLTELTLLLDAGKSCCVRAITDRQRRVRARPARTRLLTSSLAGILAMSLVGCGGPETAWHEIAPMTAAPAAELPIPISHLRKPVEEFSTEITDFPIDNLEDVDEENDADVSRSRRVYLGAMAAPSTPECSDSDLPTSNG